MSSASRKALPRRSFLTAGLLLPAAGCYAQRSVRPDVEFIGYERVEPLLKRCKPELPEEFAGLSDEALRSRWAAWVRSRDQAIRSRLLRGEEDSLVNFVLYGVSFTNKPHITPDDSANVEGAARLFNTRVQDLIRGISTPADNERLLWLRDLVTRQGYSTTTPDERERLAHYVLENIAR